MFRYGFNPKNDLYGYNTRETTDVNVLFEDMATNCLTTSTIFGDKEMTSVATGKTWISKNYRNNANVKERGNIALIDYEGSKENFDKLLKCLDNRKLWYLAVPSQNNKSKKETRYHIVIKLSKPYSINSQAMKKQVEEFFKFIDYKWDEPDSGIDPRATFSSSGYFSPSIPMKTDKKSKGKTISNPYVDLNDVFKDSKKSNNTGEYTPTVPDSDEADEEFNIGTVRGRRLKGDMITKVIRTTRRGYVLSADTHIMTGDINKFTTFENLVDKLADIKGENPRISGLGCPICNPGHTEQKPGYAYMQYDEQGYPYICCTGNACKERPYFSMADGGLIVYKINKGADYVMLRDEELLFTHKENETYEHTSDSVIGELYKEGQAILDDFGMINVEATRKQFCIQADRLDIIKNPWKENGLDQNSMTYNISKPAKFVPTESDPDKVISEAIKVFDNDILIGGYPAPLVYLSYYLFHPTRIMASLFLINHQTGSGKTFWTYELPAWYLGETKVGLMDRTAMTKSWGDVKLGKRLVVYEDIDGLDKKQVNEIASDIKTMATAAGSNVMLDIKGRGQMKSYGYNILGTSNDEKQVPVSGEEDRRIYISEVRLLENASWIREQLMGTNGDKHKANAINYLFKIYNEVKDDKSIHDAIFYRVPSTNKKKQVTNSQSNDGIQAMNIIKRGKRVRNIVSELIELVDNDVDVDDLKDVIQEIDFDKRIIAGCTLKKLWEMMPSYNSMKKYNQKTVGKIFGLIDYKNLRFSDGSKKRGFIF